MEVVGGVASVFTLVEVAIKGYGFVKEIQNIPSEFSDLCEKITQIASLVDEAKMSRPRDDNNLHASQNSAIAQAETRLEEILSELQELQSKCGRPTSQGLSKASKRKWIASRVEIAALLEKARSTQQTLILAQQAKTIRAQNQLVAGQETLLTQQAQSGLQVQHQLDQFELYLRLLPQLHANVLAIQANLPAPQETGVATIGQELDNAEDQSIPNEGGMLVRSHNDRSDQTATAKTPLKLRATLTAHRKTKCPSACACRCHSKPSKFKTPTWAGQLIGQWELKYQPYQKNSRWEFRCPCQKRDGGTTIEWRPPNWPGIKLLFSMPSYTLQYALRPSRVVSHSDITWNYVDRPMRHVRTAIQRGVIALFPDDEPESGFPFIELVISDRNFDVLELLLREWQNVLPRTGLRRQLGYTAQRVMMELDLGNREISLLQDVLFYTGEGEEPETTPLHEAIRQGSAVQVQQVLDTLDKGEFEILNVLDRTGSAPLHLAIRRGHDEIVQKLISAGADLNCKDSYGYTPLIIAATRENIECMKLLLNANGNPQHIINEKDLEGITALHRATSMGSVDGVRLLLENGAIASTKSNIGGYTPLHLAATTTQEIGSSDLEMILDLLLSAQDVDINQTDSGGVTPLQHAAVSNNLVPLRFLIEKGASTISINRLRGNLLHGAAPRCSCEILHYLNTLNLSGISTRLVDEGGNTPWDHFVYAMKMPSFLRSDLLRRPNEAGKLAFTNLYKGIRDRNLNDDISLLQKASVALSDGHPDRARSYFLALVDNKQKCGEEDSAKYYRGIERKINAGDMEASMKAIEEELDELKQELASDPWDQESEWYTLCDASDYADDGDSDDSNSDIYDDGNQEDNQESDNDSVDNEETEGI